mgnify:CR=1 FL=1
MAGIHDKYVGESERRLRESLATADALIAQGSEFGFGKPYARGINDSVVSVDDRFLHIVSCNTHNIAALIKTLAMDPDGESHLEDGRFLCIRRANDISQSSGFVAA